MLTLDCLACLVSRPLSHVSYLLCYILQWCKALLRLHHLVSFIITARRVLSFERRLEFLLYDLCTLFLFRQEWLDLFVDLLFLLKVFGKEVAAKHVAKLLAWYLQDRAVYLVELHIQEELLFKLLYDFIKTVDFFRNEKGSQEVEELV